MIIRAILCTDFLAPQPFRSRPSDVVLLPNYQHAYSGTYSELDTIHQSVRATRARRLHSSPSRQQRGEP